MTIQSRTEQRRILAAEQARGWHGLVWFVTAQPPGSPAYAAAYPGKAIPVVPVAPDPEISRHWVHLLQELFRSAEPGWAFGTSLTNAAGLERAGVVWYVFGETDDVCPACAAVNGGWECCDGSSAVRRMGNHDTR